MDELVSMAGKMRVRKILCFPRMVLASSNNSRRHGLTLEMFDDLCIPKIFSYGICMVKLIINPSSTAGGLKHQQYYISYMALYVGVFAIGSTNTATKINSAASHMAPGEVGKNTTPIFGSILCLEFLG